MPNCIILRGLPGSGKSHLAKLIVNHAEGVYRLCSADDFFVRDGKYKFDGSRIGLAHDYCWRSFVEGINLKLNIIVDNTNTTKKEYERYVDYAKNNGYIVSIVTVDTLLSDEELAKRNTHGVPALTISKMRTRLQNGI